MWKGGGIFHNKMEDILLCVSSPPEFDLELFSCYTGGKTADEAFQYKLDLFRKSGTSFGLEFRSPNRDSAQFDQSELLRCEVIDQYRSFQIIEHYLSQPNLLKNQSLCIICEEMQPIVIEKYWSLDDIFVREVLNKRLTKSRKDLEDACDSTGLNLRRVTRQFDNIKHICTAFEDASQGNNIYTFIIRNFLLSHQLARKYACIVFLVTTKFNLTSKRRILKVSCESLEFCAALILAFLALDSPTFFRSLQQDMPAGELSLLDNNGSCWSFVWKIFHAVESMELDKQLLVSLRDLKALVSGEALDAGCTALRARLGPTLVKKLDNGVNGYNKIRNIVKHLLQIGANLSQTREYRDLFEDILTKIAEPLEESNLTIIEMNNFVTNCYYIVCDISEASRPFVAAVTSMHRGTSADSNMVSTRTHSDSVASTVPYGTNKFASKTELGLAALHHLLQTLFVAVSRQQTGDVIICQLKLICVLLYIKN